MKSPLTISYRDLIKEQERILAGMKASYPAKVREGSLSGNTAAHRIAVHEQLLKMLKKHEKGRQLNLNDLFDAGSF